MSIVKNVTPWGAGTGKDTFWGPSQEGGVGLGGPLLGEALPDSPDLLTSRQREVVTLFSRLAARSVHVSPMTTPHLEHSVHTRHWGWRFPCLISFNPHSNPIK